MQDQLREYKLDRQLTVKVESVEKLCNDGEQKFKRVVSEVKDGNGKSSNGPKKPTAKTH